MIQIFPDLWQTRDEHPFESMPEAVHNAYLLTRPAGNVLIYSPGPLRTHEEDYRHIEELGGIDYHIISHYHEAGEAARDVKRAFNSTFCCHSEDSALAERKGTGVDLLFTTTIEGLSDLEILPTPGHTPGSTCFLYNSPYDSAYLFTGGTIVPGHQGWISQAFSDGDETLLHASLERLKAVKANVVIGSSAVATKPYVAISPDQWVAILDDAQKRLDARIPAIARH
jgi:glyoxylase-like metal-dependent hydrolase (beta-lactamase superfamily II)